MGETFNFQKWRQMFVILAKLRRRKHEKCHWSYSQHKMAAKIFWRLNIYFNENFTTGQKNQSYWQFKVTRKNLSRQWLQCPICRHFWHAECIGLPKSSKRVICGLWKKNKMMNKSTYLRYPRLKSPHIQNATNIWCKKISGIIIKICLFTLIK